MRLEELTNRREATARRLRDVRNPQKWILVFTSLFSAIAGFGVLLASTILMRFFALGAWAALYAWTPESYPTEIRTTGMGWASGMARVAGVITPTLGGSLFGVALVNALSAWAAAFVSGGLVVFALGVETKRRGLSDLEGA